MGTKLVFVSKHIWWIWKERNSRASKVSKLRKPQGMQVVFECFEVDEDGTEAMKIQEETPAMLRWDALMIDHADFDLYMIE